MASFSITLISNAKKSIENFPSNTVAKFTTQLYNSIDLAGNYEMTMTDVILPISFHNVRVGDCEVTLDYDVAGNGMYIAKNITIYECPPGNYTSINQLLNYINETPLQNTGINITYNEQTGHVEVKKMKLDSTGTYNMCFSPKLRAILGYPQIENFKDAAPSINPFIDPGPAPGQANLYINVPQQLFVYCDIVEPQMVGDGCSKLLRNIGIEDVSKFGHLFVKTYDNSEYIPVLRNHFTTIEIDIRTVTDDPAPFEFGTSLVKVHFRPVSS